MKPLIIAAILGLGLLATPAPASAATKSIWTTINDSAPRSIFDQIRDSAPRSVFDQLNSTAPRMATTGNDSIVGELAPVFDTLRDNAP